MGYAWLVKNCSPSALMESFSHLLYPSFCLHCNQPKCLSTHIFCDSCASLLQVLDAEGRCQLCFSEEVATQSKVCADCRRRPMVWRRMAAVWDYFGPAATLVTRLKYGGQHYLAKSMAAFLVAQVDFLQWPLPNAIVPVPMSLLKRLSRGYNQTHLIALEMGDLLGIPVIDALARSEGDYAQAGLSFAQRQRLQPKRFVLKKKTSVADQRLLLIDDVFTTGSTLRCCAEAIIEGHPNDVYALTVCRATR